MESFQNTQLEEEETKDSKVVSEQWEKLKEVFVERGFYRVVI